jgi:hypothetical protein
MSGFCRSTTLPSALSSEPEGTEDSDLACVLLFVVPVLLLPLLPDFTLLHFEQIKTPMASTSFWDIFKQERWNQSLQRSQPTITLPSSTYGCLQRQYSCVSFFFLGMVKRKQINQKCLATKKSDNNCARVKGLGRQKK